MLGAVHCDPFPNSIFFCAIGCQGLFFDLVYIKVGGYFVGFDIFTFFLEKLFI